jgi:hypothetical protein
MTRLMLILFLTGSAMNDDHHQRQNKEMITPAEGRLWQALKDMQWQSQLSEAERKQVIEGLLSPKEDIYGEAIIVVGVHRLREMLPVLEGVAGGRRELYDRMIEALKTPGDPVIFLRDVAPKLHGSPPGVVVRDVRLDGENAARLRAILTRLEESKDPWLANDAKLYRTLMKAP